MNESCIESTAPQEVTVVTTAKRAEGTIPNLTSFPSIFPPDWMCEEAWSMPSGASTGLPPCSDQMVRPSSGRNIRVMAIRSATPLRLDPIMTPNMMQSAAGMRMRENISTKFENGVGFSSGCAELAL